MKGKPVHSPAAKPPAGRPCQAGIPVERGERDRIRAAARAYVASHDLRAPLGLNDLHDHAVRVLADTGSAKAYKNWTMVLLNSESWREPLAAIPYSRRLLLLPQCLRDREHCQGVMDELGLVCKGCGHCILHGLKQDAEALGYVTLISEGTAAVLALVQSGQIAGFVGASCMATLEKVFPVMSVVAVPAIAVPLLRDGCANTALDEDWLREAIHLNGAAGPDDAR